VLLVKGGAIEVKDRPIGWTSVRFLFFVAFLCLTAPFSFSVRAARK
jgi:hypothetical protein